MESVCIKAIISRSVLLQGTLYVEVDPIPKVGINVSLQCFRVGNMERSRNYLIDFLQKHKIGYFGDYDGLQDQHILSQL